MMSLARRMVELASVLQKPGKEYRDALKKRDEILDSKGYNADRSKYANKLSEFTKIIHKLGHVDIIKNKYGLTSKTIAVLNYVLGMTNGNGVFSTGKGEKSRDIGKQLAAVRKNLPKAYLESPPVCYRGVGKLSLDMLKQLMQGETHLEQRAIEHWTTHLWGAEFFAFRSGTGTGWRKGKLMEGNRFAMVYKKRIPPPLVLLNCITASRDLERTTGASQWDEVIAMSSPELSTVKLSDCVEILIPVSWIPLLGLPKPRKKIYAATMVYYRKGNKWIARED